MGWVHPELHPVFETLGYAAGFAIYMRVRARQGDFLPEEGRWLVIAAAALGALVGSRVLGVADQAPRLGLHWAQFVMPGGKTIVGGLLGGWSAVEIAKRASGIRSRTGDLFALPLCVGIAVGRVGCLLAGLADDTYGKPTRLPWGVDLGDGVSRHPVQVYEILFLALLGAGLSFAVRRQHPRGAVFRWFLGSYLLWRIAVDFLKPQPLLGGLDLIQWACVAGLSMIVAEVAWRRPAWSKARR